MSRANVEWYRQWRKDVDAALLREEGKLLDTARAAVVEAAKAWLYAGKDEATEAATTLALAVASLERLERPDA